MIKSVNASNSIHKYPQVSMSNKPTLVILPGWGGSHDTWQDFIESAREKFEVVCIDLPCFGDEPCPTTVWSVEDYSNFVYNKIKNSKFQFLNSKFILLGHSFGGQVAVQVALDHPEMFSKLILSGAALIRPPKKIRRFIFGLIAKIGKFIFKLPMIEKGGVLVKKVFYKIINARDYNEASGIKQEIFKNIIRQDFTKKLPSTSVPTLIIWGTKDTFVPLRYGKKIARLIPNSTLKIIKKGGHGLHLYKKREMLSIICDYVFDH